MLQIEICECQDCHEVVMKKDPVIFNTSMGQIMVYPMGRSGNRWGDGDNFGFCKNCGKAYLSKEKAKSFVQKAIKAKKKKLGLLTGEEMRRIRSKMNMSLVKMGRLLQIPPTNIFHWENNNVIQDYATDNYIRMKTEKYFLQQAPSRNKSKKVFSYMMKHVDTSKLFLNKMMFYADFWSFKKFNASITDSNYVPMQYGPCPKDYQEILKEMIGDGEITPVEGHRFRVDKSPDMSEFSEEAMQSIDDIITLAKNDKGKRLFDLSHKEPGFLETPLYETIPYEYAKDLQIEELLDEIKKTA
jgi:DNA-binding transcriptional regulator YiaG